MEKELSFSYSYSAKANREIQQIRNKYLPHGESKMDELKRLDHTVRTSGMIESLCIGIGGALFFGLGLCLAMQVIGSGVFSVVLGMILGIGGMVGMAAAYPIYHRIYNNTKAKYTTRILKLAAELTGEADQVS